MSVIWTHGAEGSGQFRSLLIYNCKSFTFPHTLIIHLFVIYLQNPTDSSAFLQSPFARMAELVDALDSKSNVLKKTCRFEPGFGHKKMRVKTLIFLCPDGAFCLIGERFPKPTFCRFAPRPALLHPRFLCPDGSSPKVVIRTGLTQLLLGISPFIRRQSAEENPPE